MSSSLPRKINDPKMATVSHNNSSSSIIHHSYVPTISLPQKVTPSVSELIDLDYRYHPIYPSSSTIKSEASATDFLSSGSSEPDQGMMILQEIVLKMKKPKYKKMLINGQDYGSSQPRDELGGYCNFIKEKRGEWIKERSLIKNC